MDSAGTIWTRALDHLLFSFHGIPERHLRKSDPTGGHCLQSPDCCRQGGPALGTCYRAQCLRTVDAFVRKAAVIRYSVSFQSRLGRDPWLKPYTDLELERLAREGVRRLRVICPAFVSDCLETIEEIGIRGRETFLSAGGTDFALIPCLNEHPSWIRARGNMVTEFANSGAPPSWMEPSRTDCTENRMIPHALATIFHPSDFSPGDEGAFLHAVKPRPGRQSGTRHSSRESRREGNRLGHYPSVRSPRTLG